MTGEADRSVVLALLQVAFLGEFGDSGMGPWRWPFSCLPDLVADCHESGDYILSTCVGTAKSQHTTKSKPNTLTHTDLHTDTRAHSHKTFRRARAHTHTCARARAQ